MSENIILTPNGIVVPGPSGGKAQLKWDTKLGPRYTQRYNNAQKFVDSEVLRLSEPFTPMLTGTLVKTGILGTHIGSGTVKWIAPYAAHQYYKGRSPGLSNFGPLRGRFWFERMKEVYGHVIITGAKRIVGKGK